MTQYLKVKITQPAYEIDGQLVEGALVYECYQKVENGFVCDYVCLNNNTVALPNIREEKIIDVNYYIFNSENNNFEYEVL